MKTNLDSDDEKDEDDESYDVVRAKMLNGERIKTKGSIFDTFTTQQQKDVLKMKQKNKIKKS